MLPLSLNPITPGVDFDFGPRRASLCTLDGSTIIAAVIGINTGERSDHERYRTQMGFSFPLLHDPGAQWRPSTARVRKMARCAAWST
jgi:hypothetical protein